MTDGLKDAHREAIIAVIAANDRVERAVLFGSRATGTNTVSSDVDIALFGDRLTLTDQARLAAALDEIPMAQSVDLLLYDSLQDRTLREHIRNQGIEWFARPVATRSFVSHLFDVSGNWSTMPFSDLVFFQEGPGIRNWQYRTQGVPFVNIRCLVNGRLDVAAMNCLDPREVQERYRHFLLDEGDYVVSSSGTIGRIAEVCREDLPCMLNTSVIRMRPRDDRTLDRRFLRYFLTSSAFQDQIRSLASGSVQANYGPTHLEQVSILVPPHSEQRSIGHILGTLDDKIELNRRMNATLEAMARALFKSWFVDFDPVRAKMEGRDTGLPKEIADLFSDRLVDSELGSVPEEWDVGVLDDAVELLNGGTPRTSVERFWNGDIPWYTAKDAPAPHDVFAVETERTITQAGVDNSATAVLPSGTTVISARGSVGRLACLGRPMAMNQTCYGIRGAGGYGDFFTYWLVRGTVEELRSRTHGTIFDTITRQTFALVNSALPPVSVADAFESMVQPIMERILSNLHQCGAIAALRDTLLPKLVSGQLRVDGPEPASGRDDRPAPVAIPET